jgi:type IV secretion system protein VirD4
MAGAFRVSSEEDNLFERALRKELTRGVEGEVDQLPKNTWAAAAELGPEWNYAPDHEGLLLGYRRKRAIGWNDDRHLLTVAGTRAGKGASLIVPNLLLYAGSVLAIDPKGELARITGRQRAKLGKLVVLDPFGENGRYPTGCYNPLDELDPKATEVIDEAGAVAQALIFYSGKGDPHWSAAAADAVRAIILMTLSLEEKYRNLVSVRQLLMLTHPELDANAKRLKLGPEAALLAMMEGLGNEYDGVVRGAGLALASMAEKERESVLSEARTQTRFLDSPALRKTLQTSDFRLKDLRNGILSVFLCLPARHMDSHDRWLRVIINLAIGALEPRRQDATAATENAAPVLLLLEEFAGLKYMEKLEAAAGQLAGSGVRLWVVVQNFGQLTRHYEKGWETFVANAGMITAFGNADMETLRHLSDKLGNVSMLLTRKSGASSSAVLGGARATQEDVRDIALVPPDGLARLLERTKRRVLVMAAGREPLILERALYYEDKPFAGMFD